MSETQTIKSLDRGLQILEIIGRSESPLTISELSKILGINKSSAFRLLATLRSRGFVINPPNSKAFVLGAAIIALADKTKWINTLIKVAQKHLKELTISTGETSHLAVLEGRRALIVSSELSPQSIGVTVRTGDSALLHCSSVGKALLLDHSQPKLEKLFSDKIMQAFTKSTITDVEVLYDQIKEFKSLGFAVDDEEHFVGVRCLGIPIRGGSGGIVAALGISAPIQRLPKNRYDELGKVLMDAGQQISEGLGVKPLLSEEGR